MLAPTAIDFSSGKVGTNGTDKSVPYSYGFWCRQNRYILKQCSAYGADIITPHLPQAASSPQAPQGEDNWVRCKIQRRTTGLRSRYGFLNYSEPGNKILCRIHVARSATVSTIVSNRATAKRSNALMWRVADTVSSIVPNRATRDNRIRSCVNAPLKKRRGSSGRGSRGSRSRSAPWRSRRTGSCRRHGRSRGR